MAVNKDELIVVGIGASAGGLDSIITFFSNMPADTNMAFIIVQHLSPDYKSLMPDLLGPKTKLNVKVAEDKTVIEPNTIYLNNFEKDLHIKGNTIYLLDRGPRGTLSFPINILFKTLGEEFKENSIGIILSGTGTDGTQGIKTIKQQGGLVFVQDPESAEFDGMPNSAVATGLADGIMTPEQLANHIASYPVATVNLIDNFSDDGSEIHEEEILNVLKHIEKFAGIDFKNYKRGTLKRRLANRMLLNGKSTLAEYTELLKVDQEEIYNILNDFLINVTDFFRDPEAFDLVEHVIIPRIFQQIDHTNTIRIWVTGCSSGEEVYTLAMLFENYIAEHNPGVSYKIFGTDIDTDALNSANAGIYPLTIQDHIREDFIQNYFTRYTDHYKIISSIRSKIVFSKHNLLSNPPFMNMDLVVCRNLLIYFNIPAQNAALGNMHFALKNQGYLFLGPSESLNRFNKYFSTLDSKWKLFQNTSEVKYLPRQFGNTSTDSKLTRWGTHKRNLESSISHESSGSKVEHLYYRLLAEKFSPNCILIDKDFNLLFIMGDAGDRLLMKSGAFDRNILKLVPNELVGFIKIPVRKLLSSEENVVITNITTTDKDEQPISLNLSFTKQSIKEINDPFIIIEFEEDEIPEEKAIELSMVDTESLASQHIKDLEYELKESKVKLQNLIEELETSNEELHSSNEELTTANEELQSTNEELQSVNEELLTVNNEFQVKNKELQTLNDDVNNLLEISNIITLFLDVDLKIRKFTPGLKRLFSLSDNDIGRSITDFSSTFGEVNTNEILAKSKAALEKGDTAEFDITNSSSSTFLCKILPFETFTKDLEGVIITFVDITRLKTAEEELSQKSYELNRAQGIANIGSWYLDFATNKVTWSEELYRMYKMDSSLPPPDYSVHNQLFTDESWQVLSAAVQNTAETGKPYRLELRMAENGVPIGWLLAIGEQVTDEEGKVVGLRGIAQDITEIKKVHEQLIYEQNFSKQIGESISAGVYVYDLEEGTNIYMNKHYERILGYGKNEINAMSQEEFMQLFHPDDIQSIVDHMGQVIGGEYQVPIEYRFKHKKGHWVWCYSVDSPFELNEDGSVKSFIGVYLDLTERKNLETELRNEKNRAESANTQKNSFLSNMSHEIRTPVNGIIGFAELLRDNGLSEDEKVEYLQIIESNSEQLLTLIDDILDISKIEANELSINPSKTDLDKLLTSISKNFKNAVQKSGKKKLKVSLKKPDKNRVQYIQTDSLRLRQVISNLLSNAIKFSESGTISFGYQIDNDFLKFFVSDEGIGMEKEKLEEIFSRFKQVYNKDQTAKFGGTGLGLSISKGLVHLLGGEISVESEEGKGTTFSFTIPYSVEFESANGETKSIDIDKIDISGKKILVADDEPHVRRYYESVLSKKGVNLLIATNGKEAVQIYQKNDDIDIILMDVRMPIMDGITAIDEILKINPDAKIIAQTAYTMNNEQQKVLDAGCVDYLSKPVQRTILLHHLDFWINRKN